MEKFDIHRFDGKDFFLWKFQMRVFLLGQELWDVVSGSELMPGIADPAAPTAAEVTALKDWKKKDNKAMMYLTQGISKGQLSKVINCESSRAIWDRLCATHEQKDETSVHLVQQQFFEYQMDKNIDISTHISKVESLARRLEDLGEKQSDTAIITKILLSLPQAYRGLMSAWDSTPKAERTLQNLTARLLKEEEMNKKMVALTVEENKAETFIAQGSRGKPNHRNSNGGRNAKFNGECHFCKRKGHKELDCWAKHPDKKPKRRESANVADSGGAHVLMAHSDSAGTGWVADSGATEHMCAEKDWFYEFKPVAEGTYPISQANKDVMFCHGIGSIAIRSQVDGKWHSLTLKDVLYVPDLGRNLFSLRQATKNGATVTMKGRDLELSKGRQVVAQGEASTGKLYLMRFKTLVPPQANMAESETQENAILWHARLGHANKQVIAKAIPGLKESQLAGHFCKGCSLGKEHRPSFSHGLREKQTTPGALIHADTCGPCSPVSFGGARYFLLIKDDATNMMFAFLMKDKTEILAKFKRFIMDWKRLTEKPIARLRTDCGTEFLNEDMRNWLLDQHIRHETTVPHCPESNGFIERSNRTVAECARSMMHGSGMAKEIWGEAVNTAVHILNRLPSKSLNWMSPIENLTGQSASLDHIKVFGSPGMVHIPKQQRTKWDEKSKEMFLVGYNEDNNSFRMFDKTSRHVHLFRVVNLNEAAAICSSHGASEGAGRVLGGCSQGPGSLTKASGNAYQPLACSEGAGRILAACDGAGRPICHSFNMGPTTPAHTVGSTVWPAHCGGHSVTGALNSHVSNMSATGSSPAFTIAAPACDAVPHDIGSPIDFQYDESGAEHESGHVHEEAQEIPDGHSDGGDSPSGEDVQQPDASGRITRSKLDLRSMTWQDATSELLEPSASAMLASDDQLDCSYAYFAACDPQTVEEALKSDDNKDWSLAMKKEFDALVSQKTWDRVPRPKHQKVIKTKWIFRTKFKPNGMIDKHKARLVAKGFAQRHGIDYKEVFAPVVRFDTVRFLLSIAAGRKLKMKQVDVVGAFLYGDIEETIYIEEPEGFETTADGSIVCRLNKALYGLKQAPRQWNKKFHSVLAKMGLESVSADPCLYVNKDKSLFFALYVDDGLLLSQDESSLNYIITIMKREFQVTVGDADCFVGIQIARKSDGTLFLHQSAYISRILQKFGMENCSKVSTPADAFKKLSGSMTEGEHEKFPYRELVGSVMFPDGMYSTGHRIRRVDSLSVPGQARGTALDRGKAAAALPERYSWIGDPLLWLFSSGRLLRCRFCRR